MPSQKVQLDALLSEIIAGLRRLRSPTDEKAAEANALIRTLELGDTPLKPERVSLSGSLKFHLYPLEASKLITELENVRALPRLKHDGGGASPRAARGGATSRRGRPRDLAKKERDAEICRRLNKGESPSDITKAMNVTRNVVRHAKQAARIK